MPNEADNDDLDLEGGEGDEGGAGPADPNDLETFRAVADHAAALNMTPAQYMGMVELGRVAADKGFNAAPASGPAGEEDPEDEEDLSEPVTRADLRQFRREQAEEQTHGVLLARYGVADADDAYAIRAVAENLHRNGVRQSDGSVVKLGLAEAYARTVEHFKARGLTVAAGKAAPEDAAAAAALKAAKARKAGTRAADQQPGGAPAGGGGMPPSAARSRTEDTLHALPKGESPRSYYFSEEYKDRFANRVVAGVGELPAQ